MTMESTIDTSVVKVRVQINDCWNSIDTSVVKVTVQVNDYGVNYRHICC